MTARPRLGTPSLVLFGLVLVQPVAPVGIYGLAERATDGHASLALLVAMAAMALTAGSYGRLAAAHPHAGSAYTYAGRELHPLVGFLAGWAMTLDYLLIPVLSAIYAALTLARLAPAVPFAAWLVGFVAACSGLNLLGLRASLRVNLVLFVGMLVTVLAFVACAGAFVAAAPGSPPAAPVAPVALWRGTALAALTYLGFDGISTLAEDARDPVRSVPRATLLVVLLTGVLGVAQVELAHLAWPDHASFPQLETAFLDVVAKVGGRALHAAFAATMLLASAGTFVAAQVGAARLLLAMGRDGALPRWPFASIDARRGVPSANVVAIGAASVAAALLLSYERTAELVSFGAFLAFLAVDAAGARRAWRDRSAPPTTRLRAVLVSIAGFAFCAVIAAGLATPAKLVGAAWLLIGIGYAGWRTRGFRLPQRSWEARIDAPELRADVR
jgi:amino acid transporter